MPFSENCSYLSEIHAYIKRQAVKSIQIFSYEPQTIHSWDLTQCAIFCPIVTTRIELANSLGKEKAIKLVDVGIPNLWEHLKDGISKACDEVCGKKRGGRSKGEK